MDNIDRPTTENAFAFFTSLSEFAYDMDAQQVKAQIPNVIHYPEIYDEAMDVLTVFKLCRQLAMINLIDDFNFKDFWDPIPKRFRAILSGMINFCRYKEAKIIVITGMKEDVHALDTARLELVDKSNQVEVELLAAQERHNAELPELWAAENEVQEAKAVVDKLSKQRSCADRVVEDAESKLSAAKDRVSQNEHRIEQLREQVACLQGQIAESPEGLEKEIQELQLGVRQQKAWLEEKSNERRSRAARDAILTRLLSHMEGYKEELNRVKTAATASDAAKKRTEAARDELLRLKQSLEAVRAEEAEYQQSVKAISSDMDRAKASHEERVQQLEARRQAALQRHQELQQKRTQEQKQLLALQTQRMEKEAEVAAARRAHEAEIDELQAQRKAVLESAEAYNASLESLLAQHSAGRLALNAADLASIKGIQPSPSPESLQQIRAARRILCSPSPARAAAERRLLMSPPPLPTYSSKPN